MVVVLVSTVAGAQVAGAQLAGATQAGTACKEPVFEGTFPYATAKQLVPMQLSGVTPGSEYLLRVNGKEVKQGIAETDKVSRKFRMPNLGDKRRDAKLVVILANDACENSPWKLKQKMGYRPPVVPETNQEQTAPPATQQQPQQQQSNPPVTTPTPTPAPAAQTPKPQLVKPVIPKLPTTPREPPKDAKSWVTPLDPYSRSIEPAPKVIAATLRPSDRVTDKANSTAALLGLGGIFILIAGISMVAWTRFRRYDDAQLAELLNPDGKLPTMLDDKALDMGGVELMGAAGVAAEKTEWEQTASGPQVTKASADGAAATPAAADEKPTVKAPVVAPLKIQAPIVPPAKTEPPAAVPVAHENGAHAGNGAAPNGTHASNGAEVANGAEAPNGHTPNGTNGQGSYRQEVEAELQRILNEAGLDTELEGILSDARVEAERQGVPIDSELMLRALTEDAGGTGKLSDSAKGELKQRFQRIAAEERGQIPGTEQ